MLIALSLAKPPFHHGDFIRAMIAGANVGLVNAVGNRVRLLKRESAVAIRIRVEGLSRI